MINGHSYFRTIIHYNSALKASPRNFSTLFNIGLAYQENGNVEEAIKSFLQVVQQDSSFIPAHQALANLYLKNNRIISSLLHLKFLAKLQPQILQNKINIAKAFNRLKLHPLAIQTLESLKQKLNISNKNTELGISKNANSKVVKGTRKAFFPEIQGFK